MPHFFDRSLMPLHRKTLPYPWNLPGSPIIASMTRRLCRTGCIYRLAQNFPLSSPFLVSLVCVSRLRNCELTEQGGSREHDGHPYFSPTDIDFFASLTDEQFSNLTHHIELCEPNFPLIRTSYVTHKCCIQPLHSRPR